MKKTKNITINIVSLLICVAMLFVFNMPIVSVKGLSFDDFIISGQSSYGGDSFMYVRLSDGTCAVTGYAGNKEEITIPETIEGIPVSAIIKLNDTHYICCKTLTIPEHVKFVGRDAFNTISVDIEIINIRADGLVIDSYAFSGMSKLKSVTIEGNVSEIKDGAFAGSKKITEITLPNGITVIPNNMCNNCTSLTSITIPDTVTDIGSQAFYGCSSLKTVNMSKNINTVALDAFRGTSFENSFIDGSDDGVIYSGTSVVGIDRQKIGDKVVIKEGTETIGESAFVNVPGLTELVMPDSLKHIENSAFMDCKSLERVKWSANLETIGGSAFSTCKSLKNVTIPASVTRVDSLAFSCCESLEELVIEDGASGFDIYTFADCKSLTNVYVPGSVKNITYGMFSDCSKLNVIVLGEGITKICDNAFQNSGVNELTIPYTVDTIGSNAIQNCVGLGVVNYGGSENEWKEIDKSKEGNWLFGYANFNYGTCPVEQFTDMPKVSDWRHPGLRFCVGENIMNGSSAMTISPDAITSRAQLITLLWRLEKNPEPTTYGKFDDLTEDWYMKAVEWGAENGIVKGTSGTTFSPDKNVTRQEAATFIYRYAEYKKYDVTPKIDLSAFPDSGSVQSFAKESLSWANATKIITGANNSGKLILDPCGVATRAQIATILMRFCEMYGSTAADV